MKEGTICVPQLANVFFYHKRSGQWVHIQQLNSIDIRKRSAMTGN